MPTSRVLIASVVVAFVVLLVLPKRGASTQRIATGTVAELHAGEWMMVAYEGIKLPVSMRESTTYEGYHALRPGARVTVWYRFVAERRPVADRVRVLTP